MDIPSANIDRVLSFSAGAVRGWMARIKGNGVGRQLDVPFARIEGVWTKNITETQSLAVGDSAPILTYVTPPAVNLYHYLYVIGY